MKHYVEEIVKVVEMLAIIQCIDQKFETAE